MSDRRTTPANARIAAAHLRGQVEAPDFVDGTKARIAAPLADLLAAPDGPRDRQLRMGTPVTVFETRSGWAFLQAGNDYVGYVPEGALGPDVAPTHRICARTSHCYTEPDFKARETAALSLGCEVAVSEENGRFARTAAGWIPRAHLAAHSELATDPVAVAAELVGTPYLWGGDSAFGIDCSGLVGLACAACGIPCPGDSDLQEAGLGRALPADAPLRRGDLLFWNGHVAWVFDGDTILHANVHHMAVAYEPMLDALARIEAQGEGSVTSARRLDLKGETP